MSHCDPFIHNGLTVSLNNFRRLVLHSLGEQNERCFILRSSRIGLNDQSEFSRNRHIWSNLTMLFGSETICTSQGWQSNLYLTAENGIGTKGNGVPHIPLRRLKENPRSGKTQSLIGIASWHWVGFSYLCLQR